MELTEEKTLEQKAEIPEMNTQYIYVLNWYDYMQNPTETNIIFFICLLICLMLWPAYFLFQVSRDDLIWSIIYWYTVHTV